MIDSWRKMMNARDESDYTSTATSSSKHHPVYFVQSPPRYSNEDVDKSPTISTQNTQIYDSPSDSSSHSSRHSSRGSSSTRLSANLRRLVRLYQRRRKGYECSVIQEDVDYDHWNGSYSRGCKIMIALMVFFTFFACFCLIIWGASRPYQPLVSMKAYRVHSFYYGQGSDHTGVPTKLLTVNCSVTMAIHNPATFFGIHVSSSPVNLFFSEITVATGQLDEYYQPKKSHRSMSVNLEGSRVPLYGAGLALTESDGSGGVPLKLEFEIKSLGNLVGNLVQTRYHKHVSCSLLIRSGSTQQVKFEKDSCAFD